MGGTSEQTPRKDSVIIPDINWEMRLCFLKRYSITEGAVGKMQFHLRVRAFQEYRGLKNRLVRGNDRW